MLRTTILVFLLSLAPSLYGQITELRNYHGEGIACSRSGLHGFADFCGADTGFYVYVFTGTVLSLADVSNSEQRLEIAPEEIFYGKPPLTLTVITRQGRCLPEIRSGDKWLFWVLKSHQGQLMVSYGDSNGPVAETGETIQLLRRLSQMSNTGFIRGEVSRSEWDEQSNVEEYFPVSGHKVLARRASDNAEYVAVTNGEGNYEFKPLPPGTYRLTANTDDTAWAKEGELTIKPGSCYSVGFALKTASTISGRILFPKHQLAAPLRVRAVLESDQHVVAASATAREDGIYELKGLNPGRYLVAAEVADPTNPDKEIRIYYPGATSADRAVPIEVGKGETRADVDFEIPDENQK